MKKESIIKPSFVSMGSSNIARSMLNQLTEKQANNVIDDLGIKRENYPIEWSAKRILLHILKRE